MAMMKELKQCAKELKLARIDADAFRLRLLHALCSERQMPITLADMLAAAILLLEEMQTNEG